MTNVRSAKIGSGIYSVRDIAKLLKLPKPKVAYWLTKYWDGELAELFSTRFSWKNNKVKFVDFTTLIEFYTLYELSESGVKTRDIIKAYLELSKLYNSTSPFANRNILKHLKSDGKTIFIDIEGSLTSLDGTKKFHLNFISDFFKKVDFDSNFEAVSFWPEGKENSIVVDPRRQFGQPVVDSTNILPETIYDLYRSGEEISYISYLYNIEEKQVEDAITFCKAA